MKLKRKNPPKKIALSCLVKMNGIKIESQKDEFNSMFEEEPVVGFGGSKWS